MRVTGYNLFAALILRCSKGFPCLSVDVAKEQRKKVRRVHETHLHPRPSAVHGHESKYIRHRLVSLDEVEMRYVSIPRPGERQSAFMEEKVRANGYRLQYRAFLPSGARTSLTTHLRSYRRTVSSRQVHLALHGSAGPKNPRNQRYSHAYHHFFGQLDKGSTALLALEAVLLLGPVKRSRPSYQRIHDTASLDEDNFNPTFRSLVALHTSATDEKIPSSSLPFEVPVISSTWMESRTTREGTRHRESGGTMTGAGLMARFFEKAIDMVRLLQ